jgi:heme exporter protein A
MPEPALIELQHFACERDDRLLFSELNASFYAGQLVQILGANGSGKTTLLRVLAGVSSDYHGQITWRGQALNTVAWEYAQASLYLGHLAGIKKSLTPLENLRWYAAIQGGETEQTLLNALVTVRLAGYQDTPCYQLSAGQLRRVALARLVFSKAIFWILDEPFTALDKAGVLELEARLAEHVGKGGLVLMTSHQDIQVPNLLSLDLQDFARA